MEVAVAQTGLTEAEVCAAVEEMVDVGAVAKSSEGSAADLGDSLDVTAFGYSFLEKHQP